MSKKITVDIGLNASDVAKGAKDGERALKDLEDAVGDLDRAAGKHDGGDEIGDDYRDGARKAEQALDDLEGELKDVQRQSEKTGRGIDDIGGVGSKSLGKVKSGASEVSSEIGQNLGEAVSSIRGDLSDLGQVGQDTFGGLAATLASTGPAGIAGAAALAAGAVGLGLVTAEIEEANKRAELLKELGQQVAEAWIDGAGKIAADDLAAAIQDIYMDPEKAKLAQEYADTLGISFSDAARAMVGPTSALDDAQVTYYENLKRLKVLEEEHTNSRGQLSSTYAAEKAELEKMTAAYEELTGIQKTGMSQANEVMATQSAALIDLINNTQGVTKEVDEFGNALYKIPGQTDVFIDAHTGQATTNLDRFKGDVDGIPEEVTTTVKVRIDDSAALNWRPPTYNAKVYVNPVSTQRTAILQ